MQLYYDLIEKVPEFKDFDPMGEEHYIETGLCPLGQVGLWLNKLAESRERNDMLISKICHYLNEVYRNTNKFTGDIRNDFQIYLFWVLNYSTIEYIKQHLDQQILSDGRQYLRAIDGENFHNF